MSVALFGSIQQSHGWASQSACTGVDPDEFFVTGAEQNRAKAVCRDCPVRKYCLADALDNRIEFGVWGGMTERERRRLVRKFPHVRHWLPLLERSEDLERVVTGRGAAAASVPLAAYAK